MTETILKIIVVAVLAGIAYWVLSSIITYLYNKIQIVSIDDPGRYKRFLKQERERRVAIKKGELPSYSDDRPVRYVDTFKDKDIYKDQGDE